MSESEPRPGFWIVIAETFGNTALPSAKPASRKKLSWTSLSLLPRSSNYLQPLYLFPLSLQSDWLFISLFPPIRVPSSPFRAFLCCFWHQMSSSHRLPVAGPARNLQFVGRWKANLACHDSLSKISIPAPIRRPTTTHYHQSLPPEAAPSCPPKRFLRGISDPRLYLTKAR